MILLELKPNCEKVPTHIMVLFPHEKCSWFFNFVFVNLLLLHWGLFCAALSLFMKSTVLYWYAIAQICLGSYILNSTLKIREIVESLNADSTDKIAADGGAGNY